MNVSNDRIREVISRLDGDERVEGSTEEMRSILAELLELRTQMGYSREQRLNFMLRMIKDTMPEVARELRTIYTEQENALYYTRRDNEFWKKQYDEMKEQVTK